VDRYDLIVIGSGPAGEKGAAQAAYFGKRVALIERAPHVGGAGINTGTVPSKTLRETALYFSGLRQRGLYGVDYSVKPDLTVHDFMYREQEVVRSLREVVNANIEHHRIDLIRGEAVFEDPHAVRVGERRLRGDVVLIATGSVPTRPAGVPFADPRVHDSDEILAMTRLPKSLAVVGAGVIGCEYATIFAALGIRVALIDGRDRLLGFLDGEVADRLRLQMQLLGVDVRLGETVIRYDTDPDGIRLDLKGGDALKTDAVLIAAGRVANVAGLALGETEESCRGKNIEYCVGRALYRTNARGQIAGDLGGELKLVFRYPDKTLLGVHVIGEIAAELVHVGLMVLQVGGTIDAFINTVFNYPSLGDAYKYAAYDGLGALARRAG